MRLAPATCLLLALAAPPAARGADGRFAARLPEAVGDVASWERITGEFETEAARGSYRFYVNPARRAMYQLMRYRVELLGPRTGAQARRGAAERVAFVPRPGTPEPMLFWARRPPGTTPAWREIGAGTDEYRAEIGVLMEVLGVHRAARAAQEP
jgi:hypothetical protein